MAYSGLRGRGRVARPALAFWQMAIGLLPIPALDASGRPHRRQSVRLQGYMPVMDADGPAPKVLLADKGYDADFIR